MTEDSSTRMFAEAGEAAEVVARQLDGNAGIVARIGQTLRRRDPGVVITCGRGSSDHAATYAKYLIESRTGLFTASAAPSINSVYASRMHFGNSVCLVISQSGESPDILAVARAARTGGAYVVAIVNAPASPLADLADDVVPLLAGAEDSVAATKSFIGSLASIVQLVAAWRRDDELADALRVSPGQLRDAWRCRWPAALALLQDTANMLVLGRGLGLGIAQEAALKLKEVCQIHAEAFSTAEVLHGPIAIAGRDLPVLAFVQDDATRPGIETLISMLAERGMSVLATGVQHPAAASLQTPKAHPVIEPLLSIQSFYRMANSLSLNRGLDPDGPRYLSKVTATV